MTLNRGKVIRKTDVHKPLESEPWQEADDVVAKRQLLRRAASKTVAGRNGLEQEQRKEFEKIKQGKAKARKNPTWTK